MANYRRGRINEEMQKELTMILRRVKDPRVSEAFISVTSADCTPDLKYAKIYYSVMGGDKKEIAKGLKAALDEILDGYDHKNLSELPEYSQVNPTSEVMAMKIYQRLSAVINDGVVKVYSIRIEESAGSGCTYFEE